MDPLPLGPGSRKVKVERFIDPEGRVWEIRSYKETRIGDDGVYVTIEELDCPRDTTPPDTKIQKIVKKDAF